MRRWGPAFNVTVPIKTLLEGTEGETTHENRDASCTLPRRLGASRGRLERPAGQSSPAGLSAMLTARDLEGWLQISVKTVYRYVQLGLIPYVKIQSNVRFRRDEILEWIERQSFRPLRSK